MINLKRAYEAPDGNDGCRILIDRLWPRGLSKNSAHIHLWLKDLAPSSELRKWYDHDPTKWIEFRARYCTELDDRPEHVAHIMRMVKAGPVTLVFAAKDSAHSNAMVLKGYLEQRFSL